MATYLHRRQEVVAALLASGFADIPGLIQVSAPNRAAGVTCALSVAGVPELTALLRGMTRPTSSSGGPPGILSWWLTPMRLSGFLSLCPDRSSALPRSLGGARVLTALGEIKFGPLYPSLALCCQPSLGRLFVLLWGYHRARWRCPWV